MDDKKTKKARASPPIIMEEIAAISYDLFGEVSQDIVESDDFYLTLAKKALRKRDVSLAVMLLVSRRLMKSSANIVGERHHDGSGLLDLALPPLDAMDAIAYLDSERERWIAWYGYQNYLTKRRHAAIRIVISHYTRRLVRVVFRAIKMKAGKD